MDAAEEATESETRGNRGVGSGGAATAQQMAQQQHTVEWRWVRGHNGHPENERCDQLAVRSATGSRLLIDEGYELIEARRA